MSIEICATIALFALATAVVLAFPLRSGNGEHAHAGPGTLTVHRLREGAAALPAGPALPAVPAQLAIPEPAVPEPAAPASANSRTRTASAAAEPADEDIAWPEHDWPEYVGRHRLSTDNPIFHRLAMGVWLYIHRHPHSREAGNRRFRHPGKEFVVFNKPPLLLYQPF